MNEEEIIARCIRLFDGNEETGREFFRVQLVRCKEAGNILAMVSQVVSDFEENRIAHHIEGKGRTKKKR